MKTYEDKVKLEESIPTMKELKELRKENKTVWTVQYLCDSPDDFSMHTAVFDNYNKAWKYYKYLKKLDNLSYEEKLMWREVKWRKKMIWSQVLAKDWFVTENWESYIVKIYFDECDMNTAPHFDTYEKLNEMMDYTLYHKWK